MESAAPPGAAPAAPSSTTPSPKAGAAAPAAKTPAPAPRGERAGLDGVPTPKAPKKDPTETTDPGAQEAKPPEPYRFKKKLKVDGKEFDADLDEDELTRKVQMGYAAQSRLGELNKTAKQIQEREKQLEAFEKDPLAYLKSRGASAEQIEAMAARMLAEKAKRAVMSPEEQRISELEQENRTFKEKHEAEERRRAEEQQAALEAKQWEQEEPQYIAEMDRVKLPKSMAVLGFMSKVGQEIEEALGGRATPEIVVRETNERLQAHAEHYVLSLPVETLVERLGPQRTKAIQQHLLKLWKERQATADPTPASEAPPPPQAEKKPEAPREYLTEAEVRARAEKKWG